jgi:Tfp pilus assembly protein PilO
MSLIASLNHNGSRPAMKSIFRKYLKTIAIIWAGCLVLFFFVYVYVMLPQKKTRKRIQKEIAERKQTYDSAREAAQEKTKARLKEEIERLQTSLGEFVVDLDDSANLALDISQIANDKEVAAFSMKDRDPHKNTKIPGCKRIHENRISVSFTAGFNQFAAFLNALERHSPVVFIDKFAITRAKQGDSIHPVDMDLAVFVRTRQDG